MQYLEYTFTMPSSDMQHDALSVMLCDLGFDSFMDDDHTFKAYCPAELSDKCAVNELLALNFSNITLLGVEPLPDKDWNEEWEASYQPVVVNERCRVRAPFHAPDNGFEYDLVIEPKMSFGTANHETTSQIMLLMMEGDFGGKTVLDMGSGTAVLAIFAKKLGAGRVVAIDNDEWAYNNAFTNVALNGCDDIEIILGDANSIPDAGFDMVLANINRNILVRDMSHYAKAMNKGASIFFSGFYVADLNVVVQEAENVGLAYRRHISKNDWVAAEFCKI